jgi:flagellar hook-associated protein 2
VGIATGLNTSDIITKLMAVDQVPLNKMIQKQTSYKSQISAYGDLSSSLSSFRSSLLALKAGALKTTTASASQTSAKEDLLTATVSATAATGSYSVKVDKLATGQRISSQLFTSPDVTFNTGTMVVGTGNNLKTVTIDESNKTLSGIAAAINKSGADVTATIQQVEGSYKLVLSSNDVGLQSRIQVTTTNNPGERSPSLEVFDRDREFGGPMHVSQDAQDAQVTIDGTTTSSPTNKVIDAIPGITMDLKKVSTEAVTLTVSKDQAVKQDDINAFVTAYNAVMSKANSLANNDTGALKHDGTLDGIVRQLKGITTTMFAGHSLVEMGLTHDKTGVMQLDTNMFSKFTAADSAGLAQTVATMSDTLRTSVGTMISSAIQTKKSNLTSKISQLDVEKADLQTNLDKKKAGYVKKFAALETIVSQLKASGDRMAAMTSGSTTSGK